MRNKGLFRNLLMFLFVAIGLRAICPSIIYADLSDGLVAYYPFNGNANDESSNGNHGTVFGATLTTDRFRDISSAYSFDGVDDYINIGQKPDFPSWDVYAVSLWFLNDGGGSQGGYGQKIISKGTWFTDFHMQVGGAGYVTWWCSQGGFDGITDKSKNYRDNFWHHVVINKKTATEGELWVDGVLKGSSTNLARVVNSVNLMIGFTAHGDFAQQEFWSGKIDDVSIYNRILSESEIGELFAEAPSYSLTVQPSTKDTYIRDGSSSDNNYGAETSIWLKKAPVDYQRRSILSFDFSALEDSAVIESAYLDLYYWNNSIGNDPAGETVEVNRLTQTSWVEGVATWNDYKNPTPWNTPGGDYTTTDQAAVLMPGAFGWVRWTVTEQVRYAQKNTSEIANMLAMFSPSAANKAGARFYSKDYADPSKHPRLIINYSGGTGSQTALVERTGMQKGWVSGGGDDGEVLRGVVWPSPRFTDNGDGTVTDNLTLLIWDKNAKRFSPQDFIAAIDSCRGLADNGGDLTDGSKAGDWYLPNIKELLSLIHYGLGPPVVPDTSGTGGWSQGDPFNNLTDSTYWSSNVFLWSPLNEAWAIDMRTGDTVILETEVEWWDPHLPDAPDDASVWCVRGGQ